MSLMSVCCQSICFGLDEMYSLTSFKQLVAKDLVRFELDAVAVAKAEVDRRSPARRLGHQGLELSPGVQGSGRAALSSSRHCRLRDATGSDSRYWAARSSWRRFSKIVARRVEGLFVQPGFGIVGDRLVDLDRVELIGKLEPFDSGREPGDCFVIRERVERIGTGGFGTTIGGQSAERRPGHGLGAELAEHKTRQGQACRIQRAGVGLGGLGECPPPALAVVLRFFEALGHPVIDRRAVRHRRVPRPAAAPRITVRVLIIVGQRRREASGSGAARNRSLPCQPSAARASVSKYAPAAPRAGSALRAPVPGIRAARRGSDRAHTIRRS